MDFHYLKDWLSKLEWHLTSLQLDAKTKRIGELQKCITLKMLVKGLYQSIQMKNQSSKLQDWGGIVGIIWATAYWATVMPVWAFLIARVT